MHSGSLRRFGGYLRTRWVSPRRIRFWLLVLVALYALLGFFALPRIIQHLAIDTAREDFDRELHIESVHTNPFTLTLKIDGLELYDSDGHPLLGWERLSMDFAWSSLVNQTWTFHTIHLNAPVVREERLDSGETRFTRLITERADEAIEDEEEPGSVPNLRILELNVSDGVLRFTDNLEGQTDAANTLDQVSLELLDIGLTVEDFSFQEGARYPVGINAQLLRGGRLTFDGTLQLRPTTALEGSIDIDKLALMQAEPYLRQFANVRLDSGTLSLNGDILTDAEQPVAFQGSGSIEMLNIRDEFNDESLIGWESLQTKTLTLNVAEKKLKTGSIYVESLAGHVVIHEDRTTNFSELLVKTPAGAEQEDDPHTDEQPTSFNILVQGIKLNNGALRFADYSLPLPFSTSIHTLSGQISTISSTSAEPAEVALEGHVEQDGLARMNGTFHAWQPTHETDLQLNFRNLQIPEYSPYTVRFAGRKIEEGTMDLDLSYTVNDKQLEGSNNLELRDFELGEETDSSGVMDLPINLAIGLLKDSDGVIDLDLAVSGDVGDPEFDIGKLIRQAVGDMMTSIVEAPLRFLAGLVGAESEDLGEIEFAEGESSLLPPQQARVDELRKALKDRPALVLEISGPFSRTFDGPALQRKKTIETLRQHLADADDEEEEPSLTTESNQGFVEAMFTQQYPDIDLEDVKARFTDEDNETTDDNGFDDLAYRNYLADEIIAAQSFTEEEIKAIANARASVVRDALVDGDSEANISAERVSLLDPKEIDSVEGDRIAMEIGVNAD